MIAMRLTVWAGLLAGLLVLPASADESLLGRSDLDRLGYAKYWDVGLDMDGGFARDAYLLDDSLYVVTDKGDVQALHAGVGLVRWAQHLTESVYQVYPPAHFHDFNERPLVVFSTSPRTIVVDRYAGDVVADMPLDRATSSGSAADGENVYFGSNDGHLYAMIWTDPRTNRAVFRWRVMAGGPVTAAPVLVNNDRDLVFASQGGSVFNCTSGFKVLNWRFATDGPIEADIAVTEDAVYVASSDRSVYCLATGSGALRWRTRFHEPLLHAPVLVGRTVYQYQIGKGVTALDADTGAQVWVNEQAKHFVCSDVDAVYFTGGDRELLKVDIGTGETDATVRLVSRFRAVPNTRDATMYLVSERGQVFCGKPAGEPRLTPGQVAEAQRRLRAGPRSASAEEPAAEVEPESDRNAVIDMDDPLRSKRDLPPVGGGSR